MQAGGRGGPAALLPQGRGGVKRGVRRLQSEIPGCIGAQLVHLGGTTTSSPPRNLPRRTRASTTATGTAAL